jgi:hypothetical protein
MAAVLPAMRLSTMQVSETSQQIDADSQA